MTFLAGFATGSVFVLAGVFCFACWVVNRVVRG